MDDFDTQFQIEDWLAITGEDEWDAGLGEIDATEGDIRGEQEAELYEWA